MSGRLEIREVRVEARKMVSDGAYGNEAYTVGFTAAVGGDVALEATLEELTQLGERAYAIVLDRLRASISQGIRESIETRDEREARLVEERDALRGDG